MQEWKFDPARDLGLSEAERLKSLKRESGLFETFSHILWWSFIRVYLRLYHRLSVRGAEKLPKDAPFIIVSNHASHLDVLVLASRFPLRLRDRIFPIAAGDTFFEKLPVAAFAAFALNALPLWRHHCDPKDLQELRRRLVEQPCAYVLFPEGTRTRSGEIGGFKRGIGSLVAGTTVAVVPCHLEGAFAAFGASKRVPRPWKLVLRVGDPLRFDALPDDREGWTKIAAEVEAAVRALAPRA